MVIDVPTRVGVGGVAAGLFTAILLAEVPNISAIFWVPALVLSALAMLWGIVPVFRHFMPLGLDESEETADPVNDLRYIPLQPPAATMSVEGDSVNTLIASHVHSESGTAFHATGNSRTTMIGGSLTQGPRRVRPADSHKAKDVGDKQTP